MQTFAGIPESAQVLPKCVLCDAKKKKRAVKLFDTNGEFFTSFNQLDLPVYKTFDKLRASLLKAIHECSEGFGFA